MVFASVTFLFLFLPAVLGINFLLRKNRNLQNVFLLLASLFFYAWGEPVFSLILMISVLTNWLLARLIAVNESKKAKKLFLALAVILNVGLLFVFKYLTFAIEQINVIGAIRIPYRSIALPIGISFFTFQALSYVIDVYRGEEYQKNPLYVGLYITFFPQLIAGPIVRYNSIADQIVNRQESLEDFKQGVSRFIQGFLSKVFLANTMAVIADKAFSLVGSDLSVSFAWLGAVCYAFQIFFDFSGYSDMAIGLGKMFGFQFEENFNYPYTSTSVTDFWRRWHISLSTWFRDYVYIPLGGSRTGSSSHNYLNLFVVWLLTGIWHGANWTFMLWGVMYFGLLLLEKGTLWGKLIDKCKALGRIYTLFVVVILWVVFRAENVGQALSYLRTMFGVGQVQLYTNQTWIYLKENFIYLLFAVILSTDVMIRINKKLKHRISNNRKAYITITIFGEICLMLLFAISVVYVINGTYNPFIYFNF